MKIGTWHIKLIYFNESEWEAVEKYIIQCEKRGWRKVPEDGVGVGVSDFDYVIPLMGGAIRIAEAHNG